MQGKLAIIAGKGDLPKMIIKKCQEQQREFLVILIKEEASNADFLCFNHQIIGFGEISKIISILKNNNIGELVFAGGVTKPSMAGIKVDAKGAVLLSKILGNKFFGDDNLLSTIINFFEKEGFKVVGADKIIEDLLAQKGIMGSVKPDADMQKDIEMGREALRIMSDLDIGQAIAVQQKQIIAVEGVEGTDNLILRSKDLQFEKGGRAVLVKMKKSNQNTKIDLPALGKQTIENLAKSGFAGVAVEANSCLIINQKEVIKLADDLGLFVVGI
jgi:DUF1009 family protein